MFDAEFEIIREELTFFFYIYIYKKQKPSQN